MFLHTKLQGLSRYENTYVFKMQKTEY